MVGIRYLGIYPNNFPDSVELDGAKTVAEVVGKLIADMGLREDFFWARHFFLLNGERPEMRDIVSDGDRLEIISFADGG